MTDPLTPDPGPPSPDRKRLPDRRPSVPCPFEWRGVPWILCVGFDQHGVAREVFVNAIDARVDAGLEMLAQDAAILMSQLLQRGVRGHALVNMLARPGLGPSHGGQSFLGAVAMHLVAVEAANGPAMVAAPALRDQVSGIRDRDGGRTDA